MVALLLKHSFMENFEQHYKSEATEDWVCSGMISFKMLVVGREKKSQKFDMIVISICVCVYIYVKWFKLPDRCIFVYKCYRFSFTIM